VSALPHQDCKCHQGYVVHYTGNNHGFCKPHGGGSGSGGYQCPSNSHKIPGRNNYDNFLVSRARATKW